MNIGELWLSLGVRGADKTVGALSSIKKGLGDIGSASLETKAGIVAAIYALEHLFAASGKMGTGLTNFNATTGESIQTLQQYQYAARQVGVTNEETEATFKSLQAAMAKAASGHGAGTEIGNISFALSKAGLGGIDAHDVERYTKRSDLFLQRLQQFASSKVDVPDALKRQYLATFLSDNMIGAVKRQAFQPEILNKAPTYSNAEVHNLDRANIAWGNLGNHIEMAIGHLNSLHGGKFVEDISKIADKLLKLADAMIKLTDAFKAFTLLSKSLDLTTIALGGIADIAAAPTAKEGKKIKTAEKGVKELFSLTPVSLLLNIIDTHNKIMKLGTDLPNPSPNSGNVSPKVNNNTFPAPSHNIIKVLDNLPSPENKKESITPTMPGVKAGGNVQNNNVKIDNHFQHPGTEIKKTTDSMKQAVNQAYRQMAVQHVGN